MGTFNVNDPVYFLCHVDKTIVPGIIEGIDIIDGHKKYCLQGIFGYVNGCQLFKTQEQAQKLKAEKLLMIQDYFEYFIGDVVYVVDKKPWSPHFNIRKEKITKIIITGHSTYHFFIGDDEKIFGHSVFDFSVFDTFKDAQDYCKDIIKNVYEDDIDEIDRMKEDE